MASVAGSWLLLIGSAILPGGFSGTAWGRGGPGETHLFDLASETWQRSGAAPVLTPAEHSRSDTLDFGFYQLVEGQPYAVANETWTWDHGAADPLEGWRGLDLTDNAGAWFQRITEPDWDGHGNQVPAPILGGAASVWLGLHEDQADGLCWVSGLGYGNSWCQRWDSPVLRYTGQGDVLLRFRYFNDSEENFDYTKVILLAEGQAPLVLNDPGFTGRLGISGDDPPVGADYERVIQQAELGGSGARDFTIRLEFQSDQGWSDEDGESPTPYGPFGADDIRIEDNVEGGPWMFDFEPGTQGWSASTCPGIGSFFHVARIEDYEILDPCGCRLDGWVAVFHDPDGLHPRGQHVEAMAPPVRKALEAPFPLYNVIMAEWDMYAEMPQSAWVFYRPGWRYYPYICPETGETTWSPFTAQTWIYTGDAPTCFSTRSLGTNWGVPPDCEMVSFGLQVLSYCEPDAPCNEETNATPLVDNVRIRMTGPGGPGGPSFTPGGRFQDNFSPGPYTDLMRPGPADITYDLHRNTDGDRLGDSLSVEGPAPTADTRWLARLWFRIPRTGPGQTHLPAYRAWLDRVADGRDIVGPDAAFTFGWMDSVQVGTQAYRSKFCSQFHELVIEGGQGLLEDDWSGDEQGESNEIIPDDVLTPGTKIEYFVTSNFVCTPSEMFLLPDTSGGNWLEFEILPGFRNVPDGTVRQPCVLFVNADYGRARTYVEEALQRVLTGTSEDPIPDPAPWDRYDYLDAGSSWHASVFRYSGGGNSGGDVTQFLGYRMILVNTGALQPYTLHGRDWRGLADWLALSSCSGGSQWRQGLWISGNSAAGNIAMDSDPTYGYPEFLTSFLGAEHDCAAYHDQGCPAEESENDQGYCVRLADVAGGAWDSEIELDLYGNWCPAVFEFDVLRSHGSGVVNKRYQKVSNGYMAPDPIGAQVVHDRSASPENYRTVLDGYSADYLIRRHEPVGDPSEQGECAYQESLVMEAVTSECEAILRWTLGIDDPLALGTCEDPCNQTPGGLESAPSAGGPWVDRLYPSAPNPFNPRTTIRFSLARSGPVRLVIYDVGGREVRTLLRTSLAAGMHTCVWDGAGDDGRMLAAGVYWSRLVAGDYQSNSKMIVIR